MEKEEQREIKKEYRVEGHLVIPFLTFVEATSQKVAEDYVQGMEITDLLLDAMEGEDFVNIKEIEEVER